MYPRWEVDPSVGWQWLFPLASVAIVIVLWLLRRRWRGPLAGWLLFIGTLFPVLGFLNVYWFVFSFVADHLLYLASLAVIVLAASAIALAIARLQANARWIGYLGCAALLATLGTLTWRQSEMYSDAAFLYQTTIARNPACWLAYNNLGVIVATKGRPRDGMEYFQQALRFKPDWADSHNNLGNGLLDDGRPQEAIAQFELALQANPNFAEAHNNLGFALASSGRLPEAIAHLEKAVLLRPDSLKAQHNLGRSLAATGRFEEAIPHYQQAIKINPDYLDAYANLATAYVRLHRTPEAIVAAQKALQLARVQGETAAARQIEEWLKSNRADATKVPDQVPHSQSTRTAP